MYEIGSGVVDGVSGVLSRETIWQLIQDEPHIVSGLLEPEQQLQRLVARGLSEAEARRRIAAQLPVEEKLLLATEKIDCSGSLEQTRRQVEALAAKLRRGQSPR